MYTVRKLAKGFRSKGGNE